METKSKQKFSFTVFGEMIRNSVRINKMLWAENRGAVVFLVLTFLIVSVTPFIRSGAAALLINSLVETGISKVNAPDLSVLIIIMILANFIPAIFSIIQGYITRIFFFMLDRKFVLAFVQKKSEIDVATHEDPETNDTLNRVREQGQYRAREFADRQYFLIQNIAEVIIASVILLFASWWIFVIIFIATIPELITEAYYGKVNWGIWSAKGNARRRFWDLDYHFTHLPYLIELKLFQNIPHFFSMMKNLFIDFQEDAIKSEKTKLFHKLISGVVSQLAIAFALVWFVSEVLNGRLLIGTLTFILAAIWSLRQSLAGLFLNLGRQYQDSFFITDFFKLMDLPKELKEPTEGIKIDPHKTPEIVFEDVTFVYPNTKEPVLKNFSLKIKSGEKIAIVGLNGAGKTTFVKLLCRFYDPTSGRVMINGHDLRNVDLESWYHMLGVIFQDYANYNLLVKDAIAIGRTGKGTDIEKVRESAKSAEADIFIEEWEKSYGQQLGKEFTGGVEPSIGQWQKLALARTFHRDPKVLVLDEPTSSIDAEAEAKIFEKLEALPKDRTVILISHRFSTVRRANQIVIIEDGLIKEHGTHEELLKLNGTYARLFNIQAKGYK